MHAYMYAKIHACTNAHKHINAYMSLCLITYNNACIQTRMHTRMLAYMRACTHAKMHMYACVYTVCMHTYIHVFNNM